jgi:hypothetical protein
LSTAVETVLVCAAVVFAHGLIARFLGPERFHRFVTAAQVFSTVLLIVGFQILPRLAKRIDASAFETLGTRSGCCLRRGSPRSTAWLAGKDAPSGFFVPALVGVGVTLVLTWSGVLRLPQIVVRSAEERAPASDPPAETR